MAEEVPAEQIRVSDIERKAVEECLHAAHADGLITLTEFDIRVGAAWQAVNRGDLAKLTADLPAWLPAVPQPQPVPAIRLAGVPRRRGNRALRVLNTIWLSVVAINLVVWGLVCVTSGVFVYPWWLWLAVPGSVLAVLWLTVGGGRPRPELPGGE